MKVINMRTNHVSNPLGFEMKEIRLSWNVDNEKSNSRFIRQSQIIIGLDEELNDIIYDSGICNDVNNLCFIPNIKLKVRTRYFWRVKVWSDMDEVAISDIAWFETSKINEKWTGKWIASGLEKKIHPIMRRKFNIPHNIKMARLYISGVGLYEVEINGKRVSDEYLAPGFNSYDFWIQYQTYDVTNEIIEGENAIGIMLGNGWYKGRFGFDGGHYNLYGDKFCAIAELIITLEDGKEIIIGTDETWKCLGGPIELSDIYDGEIYNATKEVAGWSDIQLNDSSWINVVETTVTTEKFQERLSLPVKIKEQRKAEKLIITPKGELVLDFGQNMTGWVKFKVNKPLGQKIVLKYSEIMQNKCFYQDNLRTAKAQFTYICDGEEKSVQPHFTYFGFRYVKISGLCEEEINLEDFTACVIYSDIDEVGKITTSNQDVNKLFLNALWGQKGNFLDVPTDCPQRDERMGWTGDAQIFSMTACYNMYSAAFFTKFMRDLGEEQKRLDGAVPFTVPMIKPENASDFISGKASAAWSDAATIIPWVLYKQYGDKQLLENHFQIMKDWVNYMRRDDEKSGNKRLWTVGFQFGDWLALDNDDPQSSMGGTDEYFISSAYYYYSTTLLVKAAKVLGKKDIEDEYSKLAREIKVAINKEYFVKNYQEKINTQTALVLALYMELVDGELKEKVIKDLEEKLLENRGYLKTGFIGTAYLCLVLSDNNLNEYAYKLLLNDQYPSWLYEVKLGATTIWERWNSLLKDGSISGTDMNSLNHYAYGVIVEWMYSKMLGINAIEDNPGFRRIRLEPKISNQLKYANGSFNSPLGMIESGWKIEECGDVIFEFTIPFDTEAIIRLPNLKGHNITINDLTLIDSSIKGTIHEDSVVFIVNCGKYVFRYKK